MDAHTGAMSIVELALAHLTLAVDIGIIVYLIGLVLQWAGVTDAIVRPVHERIKGRERWLILLFAATATGGSLYFSNVLGWTPCRLCWFQRILMYPIVLLAGTALLLELRDLAEYVLPLSILGSVTAFYHYGIQRIEQFHSAGCSVTAVSCSTEYTFHFGYITIPMMALTAFIVITVLAYRAADL